MNLFNNNLKAFAEISAVLFKHRDLTWEMARREFMDKYAGQALGIGWALLHPVFMMCLYLFIFAYVFKVKVGGTADLPRDYSVYMLSGLVSWMCFQEVLIKSCSSITSNASLVKQVVFPLEILPVKGVISSLFQQIVALCLLFFYMLFAPGGIPKTALLLPVLLAFQFLAMIGVAYILATIGAYFRDIKDIIQLFTMAGAYLMPVFYLPAWVPAPVQPLLAINPFSHFVWCYQDLLYFGRFEHPLSWALIISGSSITFIIGYRVFRKMKSVLGNYL
jgi:lipopolysaccharide transport system permease protein